MLAKITHAFAAGVMGLSRFDPFLPSIILGKSHNFSHYIGGITSPEDELQPPTDLEIGMKECGTEQLIFVRTTIFGNRRFPTYEIIVGRSSSPHSKIGDAPT
jgi:hypothetical protein